MCSLLAQNSNSRSKSRKTIIIKSINREIFQKLQNYLISHHKKKLEFDLSNFFADYAIVL